MQLHTHRKKKREREKGEERGREREITAWNYRKKSVKYPPGATNDRLYFKNFLGETPLTGGGYPPPTPSPPSALHAFADAFGISFEFTSIWLSYTTELLETSNFSVSYNVFHSYISLECQNVVLCGNGLTLSQTTNFRFFQNKRSCRQQFQI